ncbi:hypothetical protein BV210_01820 [Halorientalis sp. IM1011]|uniref:hypothetical protein n=1 Tax=Halorientalis sp. IM1011 TaxID=1932360 RepID=UPI00097CC9A2|nr:hypothetical protein [Halorientalis sp. IM1011]AQL41526.1 hypothetical protein BV210_01820 [Halorientalis sp. IM1011]
MVEVTYHCPYCGAVTGVEREGYLDDDCVTREPLDGWEYASTTDDIEKREAADGIEFVCLGDGGEGEAVGQGVPASTTSGGSSDRRSDGDGNDPDPEKDGCGRTFYLSFRKSEGGERVDHRTPDIDPPRFDFRP